MNRSFWLTRAIKALLDFGVLTAAYCFAFMLRFEGSVPPPMLEAAASTAVFVILIQYLSLASCKVPRFSWQYVSLLEVGRIWTALVLASLILLSSIRNAEYLTRLLPCGQLGRIPRSVVLIDLLLGLTGVIGVRVAVRLLLEWRDRGKARIAAPVPTLLIGAERAGAETAKEIAGHPELGMQPIGFLDDDPGSRGRVIHGISVLGPVADAPQFIHSHSVKLVLITTDKLPGERIRRIVDLCKSTGIATKIIPAMSSILEGKVNLSAIREVAIEDLLRREPVQLDSEEIADFVKSQTILISGAGGSIGSELCRTVCRFGADQLLLVERAENNLFQIHRELTQLFPAVKIVPCLADISDVARMDRIFSSYRPAIVLHAAAHKHVPMMEWNAGEAVKNNVAGTRTIADLAARHGVNEFVMISTDKAVNPTSVMGASKRIAEIYIQALSQRSQTRFVAVRFGNVLGSTGSVIPLFKEQIGRGGPITITHPDMMRYFMTIPEACVLVLQAATMGQGGEIFFLDMGQPVKIVDLARDLICLSGLAVEDIEVKFTGPRPGEKLFEELALQEETSQRTQHPKIYIGHLKSSNWTEINSAIDELLEVADCLDGTTILRKLKRIVPEYCGVDHPDVAEKRRAA